MIYSLYTSDVTRDVHIETISSIYYFFQEK